MQTLIAYAITVLVGFQGGWRTDFEKAQLDARAADKLILLKFSGSDWCIPCMKMDGEIFSDPSFRSFSDAQLVLIYADFPRKSRNKLSAELKKQNEKLAATYNPSGKFPFTILMTPEGKVLRSWDGYPQGGKSVFLQDIQQITNGYHDKKY